MFVFTLAGMRSARTVFPRSRSPRVFKWRIVVSSICRFALLITHNFSHDALDDSILMEKCVRNSSSNDDIYAFSSTATMKKPGGHQQPHTALSKKSNNQPKRQQNDQFLHATAYAVPRRSMPLSLSASATTTLTRLK